jgi:hypothetical protein
MSKIPKYILVIGVAIFLVILTIGTYNSKAGKIITGITALYIGSLLLYDGIKGNAPDYGALKFRSIGIGAVTIIIGLVYSVQFFIWVLVPTRI